MNHSRGFLTLSLVCTRVRYRLPGEDREPKAAADLAVSSVGTRDHRYDARAAAGQHNQSVGCQQLTSKYSDLTFYPNSANYTYEDHRMYPFGFTASSPILWLIQCRTSGRRLLSFLRAVYSLRGPRKDVAGDLALLVQTDNHFDLRSGGHMSGCKPATPDSVLVDTSIVGKTSLRHTLLKSSAGIFLKLEAGLINYRSSRTGGEYANQEVRYWVQ